MLCRNFLHPFLSGGILGEHLSGQENGEPSF